MYRARPLRPCNRNLLVAFVLDVIEEKKEEGRLQGRLEGAEARGDGH